jgi:dTMP kinase
MSILSGKFIVLDGPDGAGKSTQAQLLGEAFESRGQAMLTVRDPGGTVIGDEIRRILLDNANTAMAVNTEVLLYMASRAQLYAEKIKPALEAGQCVISDRWLTSTLAYQAVAGKIGNTAVAKIAEAALERPWPDLTCIIDLPAETGLARVGDTRDRMENKGSEFHQAVRLAFRELAKSRSDCILIDGAGTIEQIHQTLLKNIMEKL